MFAAVLAQPRATSTLPIFHPDGGDEQAKSLCFPSLAIRSSHRSCLSTGRLPYIKFHREQTRTRQDRTGSTRSLGIVAHAAASCEPPA